MVESIYGTIENVFKIYNIIAKIWQYMMNNCDNSLNDSPHIGVYPVVTRYKNNYRILTNKEKEIDESILKALNNGTLPKYTGFYYSYSLENSDMTKTVAITVILAEFDEYKLPVVNIDKGYFTDSHLVINLYLDKNIFLFNIENNAQINAEENCVNWFIRLFKSIFCSLVGLNLRSLMPIFFASLFVGGALNRSAHKMVQLFKNGISYTISCTESDLLSLADFDMSNYDFDELELQFGRLIKIQEINSPIINSNMDTIKKVILCIEHIDFNKYLMNKINQFANKEYNYTFKKNPLFKEDEKYESGLISEE